MLREPKKFYGALETKSAFANFFVATGEVVLGAEWARES